MQNTPVEAGDAVVVPAIRAGSSVTCVRSLGRRGVRPLAVHDAAPTPVCHSRYCDEVHTVPSPSECVDGYRDALLELAARPDVATLVPLREADIYVLSKHRDAFGEHVATPWPPFATVRGTQDWLELLESARTAGVSTPETRPLDEWDRWDQATVVKSRYSIVETDGRLSTPGMRFVPGGERPDVDTVVDEMGHVPIAQEYIPGNAEFGFFALFDHGRPLASFQHRRIRSYNYSGGASVYRMAVDLPALERAGRRLLSALDWHGPAMVEFRRDPRDGSFRLMEINPRFWGSLALPYHAGVDFPYLYYRLAVGRPTRSFEYEAGLGCHLLRGEVSYLHSVLRNYHELADRPPLGRSLAAVVVSLLRQPRFDYLSLDDPRPFVEDFFGAVRSELPWVDR